MERNNICKPVFLKRHAQPICWMNDSTLIYYRRGRFVLFNVESKKENTIGKISLTIKEKLLSFFSLTRRLFRLYIFSPIFDSKRQEILFSFNGYFCSYDLDSKTFFREQKLKHQAKRLLSICLCENGEVYYGEYPTRKDNTSICIFKRNQNREHLTVYRFNPNEIRHIHLISEYKNDLFCFTGDEDNETNVLRFVNKNFLNKPQSVLHGSQEYRTCVATFKNNQVYYLSDNPYFQNCLCIYNLKDFSLEHACSIEGSVIYGLRSNNYLFFSTCVEYNLLKNDKNENVVLKIDGKVGGIKSKKSILYYFDMNKKQLKSIYSLKKDFLSIKYFGIGTFQFTSNTSSKFLATFSHSLKRSDTLFIFDIKKLTNIF